MPRVSLKKERTEAILDAFERCLLQHGLQGSSLKRIAEEAGVARPILRHYIGNRDDLIVALAARFAERTRRELADFKAALGPKDRVQSMLAIFFGDAGTFEREESLVGDALIAEAHRLPKVREILDGWFESLQQFVEHELLTENPEAEPDECRAAALGIISTYLVVGSLRPMTDSPRYRERALAAAQLLLPSK